MPDVAIDAIESRDFHKEDDAMYKECLIIFKSRQRNELISLRDVIIEIISKSDSLLMLKFIMSWLGNNQILSNW